jgi:hypothetical protein
MSPDPYDVDFGEGMPPFSWWSISEEAFLSALRRVEAGEKADLVYAEFYAASDHEKIDG